MKALRRFLVRLSNSTVRRRDDTRLRDEVEEHLALRQPRTCARACRLTKPAASRS